MVKKRLFFVLFWVLVPINERAIFLTYRQWRCPVYSNSRLTMTSRSRQTAYLSSGEPTITAPRIPLMLANPDTQSLWRTASLRANGENCRPLRVIFALTFQNHTGCPLMDFGGKTCIFSHPVYLFLREFSLQDSRGSSVTVNVSKARSLTWFIKITHFCYFLYFLRSLTLEI